MLTFALASMIPSGLSTLTLMTFPSMVLAKTRVLSAEMPIDSLTVLPPRSDCQITFPVTASRQVIFLSGATTNTLLFAATGTHAAGESIRLLYPLYQFHFIIPVSVSIAYRRLLQV